MKPFEYARPESLIEALTVLDAYGPEARILAGGTDVVVRLRMGHMTPAVVVDVKRVTELQSTIAEVDGCLRFGANVVMTDVIGDPRVQRCFPALVEAARVVGSVQIRNRATLAGNVCNASPAADTVPALLVYGAVVNLVSRSERRRVGLNMFFAGPGRTFMRAGEIVESIDVPLPRAATGSAFGRVTRRWGVDLATINLCCLVTAAGVTRFAYGAVGPTPILAQDESGVLATPGAPAGARARAIEQVIAAASPISDIRGGRDYRQAMLAVMSGRTLDVSLARLARGGGVR